MFLQIFLNHILSEDFRYSDFFLFFFYKCYLRTLCKLGCSVVQILCVEILVRDFLKCAVCVEDLDILLH